MVAIFKGLKLLLMTIFQLVSEALVSFFELASFGIKAIFSLSPFPLHQILTVLLNFLNGQLAFAGSLVDFADPFLAVLLMLALLLAVSLLPPAQLLLEVQLEEGLLFCLVFVQLSQLKLMVRLKDFDSLL